LTPGKPETVVPQADIRITNVALGDILADASGRTTVKLTYNSPAKIDSDDEGEPEVEPQLTTILCSLTAGKIEQTVTDVVLEQDDEYLFETIGPNVVYLTGNYIDQIPPDNVPYNDLSESDAGYDLREVSSDVEIDPAELDELESDGSRFEEIEEKAKPSKRPRESDAIDTDVPKSKAEKKANKKLKNEEGKAVPTAAADEEKKEKKKEKKEQKADGANGSAEYERDGIKIKDVKVGTGPMAKKGNTVSMRYIGKLPNGKEFDRNTKGKPFKFRLAAGEVIKGWDEGIVGMQVGGERLLTIPANKGYGKRGTEGIPPNSTLIFEVKLLEIK